jgi:DNA-binding NarL/FixJ family response regulator
MRQGLARLVRSRHDILIVGEATDGLEAIEQARKLQPDLIIMDVSMPRLNGVEATRRVKTEMPWVRVIALSMHEDKQAANAMMEAGADSFVVKTAPIEVLMEAIAALCPAESPAATNRYLV